jgi:hypothetical protein
MTNIFFVYTGHNQDVTAHARTASMNCHHHPPVIRAWKQEIF